MRCAAKNVPALGDQLPKRPGFGGSRARYVLRLVSVGNVRVDPPRLPKTSRLLVSEHSAVPPHDSTRCQNTNMVIPRATKNVPALGDQRRCSSARMFQSGSIVRSPARPKTSRLWGISVDTRALLWRLFDWARSVHAKNLSTARYPTAASAELARSQKRPGFGGSIACSDPPRLPKTSRLRGISCQNVPASGDLG